MNDDPTDSNEEQADVDVVDYAARKRRIVLLLLVYSLVAGAIFVFVPEDDTQLEFLLTLPYLILGVSWCFADARERDHRMSRGKQLVLVLFFVIGFPIYLIETRGLRGFNTLAGALLLVLAMAACQYAAGYATYFAGDALGLFDQVDDVEFYEKFDE